MGILVSISERKNSAIFFNISFILVSCAFLLVYLNSPEIIVLNSYRSFKNSSEQSCKSFQRLDNKSKCLYLKSQNPCVSQGYIDYLYLFYCNFESSLFLGYSILFLWLLVLFYLLGNTASEYFCPSLEGLSGFLRLSPAIAGVTLLSLGNGAPDVFSVLVSFIGEGGGSSEIGINTILGGVSFVSCVVVGVLSISIRRRHIQVKKSDFIRDVCFLLLIVVCLAAILIHNELDVWVAIAFTSLYIVYVIVVSLSHIPWNCFGKDGESDADYLNHGHEFNVPLLHNIENGELNYAGQEAIEGSCEVEDKKGCFRFDSSVFWILELPLNLPRRLTIPLICEDKWSKQYAVASVALAPLLISILWNDQLEYDTLSTKLFVYGIGLIIGIMFGVIAYKTTEKSIPPKKCLLPWLAAGFFMSVTWSYIIAQELVGLLVSIGYIFGINPSILGLTVLAWGNSLGDLITNLTMAVKGGPEGTQIAFSGCYAGPIFNTLFGLGLSLVGYSWSKYPSSVVITKDPYLFQTLGFLAAGLIWALFVLPRRDMKLDGVLGGGLVVIYIISLSFTLIQTLGFLQLQDISGYWSY